MATPLNIAHRGGAQLWPENTLYAFEQAAAAGYDGAELDVQLSRDGELIVFHDFRLKPELCRDGNGHYLKSRRQPLIRDLSFAELRAYDVGRVKEGTLYARRHPVLHPRDGERMPLLSEVVTAVARVRSFRLFIEIKTSAEDRTLSAPPEAVADAVVAELRSAAFVKQATLVGFDWAALLHAKRVEPQLACWFTTKRRAPRSDRTWAAGFHPSRFGGSIAEAIKAAGGEGWLSSRAQATRARIEAAQELGLKVGAWTVNDKRGLKAFQRLGVDAIVTDRPDRLADLRR